MNSKAKGKVDQLMPNPFPDVIPEGSKHPKSEKPLDLDKPMPNPFDSFEKDPPKKKPAQKAPNVSKLWKK